MLDTNYMAGSRTLLALVRTGAVIAGGGALVTDLLVKGWPDWVVVAISSCFVVLGYWLIWSAMKTSRRMRARFEADLPGKEFLFPHRSFMVVTVALQVLMATVVVLYLLSR
jgi:hypothetical protein